MERPSIDLCQVGRTVPGEPEQVIDPIETPK
jgi:hypothetical protein